jgi:hypothetical protein
MSEGDVERIKANIAESELWSKLHDAIITRCEDIIPMPTLERIQTGRRLLDVSREALNRIFHLSYAYRLTGEGKYLDRAMAEMSAVAEFSDWNPSHYLDVAEMTLGMAIGYDWLYNDMPQQARIEIRDAILTKGIDTSFRDDSESWKKAKSNWNQVCNTGIVYGAMALWEDIPQLARSIIDASIESIALPMGAYAPDGAYPEGFTYWGYGTSFNVLYLSALEKLFGDDLGLSAAEGFLPSAAYIENMIAPSKRSFNYGDSNDPASLAPALFWFAGKTGDHSVLRSQLHYVNNADELSFTSNRLFPAIMIWGKDIDLRSVPAPSSKLWVGLGATPVASMRNSWSDPNAVFAALKAGRAWTNHSHMDAGSFIMESDGVRWALDLGAQDYNSLESAGVDLWNRRQESGRWDVYRYNNFAHNTLTFNGNKQDVMGSTTIERWGESEDFTYAVCDLTAAYPADVASAVRGIALVEGSYIVVRDEVTAGDKPARMRWAMVTRAGVKLSGGNTVELSDGKRRLVLEAQADTNITFRSWPATPANPYDAPNEGVTIVGFETELAPGASASYVVKLIPGKARKTNRKILPLQEWE